MSLEDFLKLSNVLIVPAFAYIIVLERRITRMQTQIEQLLGAIHG